MLPRMQTAGQVNGHPAPLRQGVPPPDEDERGLIGALMIDPSTLGELRDITPAYFGDDQAARLWGLLRGMIESGQLVATRDRSDVTTIARAAIDARIIERPGELAPYIAPCAGHHRYYAARVRQHHLRRRLAGVADLLALADDPTTDPADLVAAIRADLDRIAPATSDLPTMTAAAMLDAYPTLGAPVIEGLLRAGETCNVIAAPKVGKSWLVLGLAYAVATGREWLGHTTRAGRVLLVDNELHAATLALRLYRVASALAIDPQDAALDCWPIRGQGLDIHALAQRLERVEAGRYGMIVLDALYRFLPRGASENDNAAMMQVYNTLDRIAAATGAAIVVVHHSSKGDQGNKAQTDVGAGAGSIARAADCHLTIRAHESEGLAVMEAVTRSWASPDPVSIRWEWPTWTLADDAPVLRQGQTAGDLRQERNDHETTAAIIEAIRRAGPKGKVTQSRLLSVTGYTRQRVQRGLRLLQDAGQVVTRRARVNGSADKVDVFRLPEWPKVGGKVGDRLPTSPPGVGGVPYKGDHPPTLPADRDERAEISGMEWQP